MDIPDTAIYVFIGIVILLGLLLVSLYSWEKIKNRRQPKEDDVGSSLSPSTPRKQPLTPCAEKNWKAERIDSN